MSGSAPPRARSTHMDLNRISGDKEPAAAIQTYFENLFNVPIEKKAKVNTRS